MATAVKRREMFIGGQWVAGSGSEGQPVTNPATGETIAEVPKGTEADVDRAVKAARKAYVEWFETVPKERSEMLLKLAEAVAADGEELANLESANVGKPRALFLSDELPPASTTFASSPARRDCSRARRPASTCEATPA